MSRILAITNTGFSSRASFKVEKNDRDNIRRKVLLIKGKKTRRSETNETKGSVRVGLVSACLLVLGVVLVFGAYYLYQVNDLATKGYEIRDMENRIAELEKEGKKMEIKEVELRSMYNIEKATQDLNLVNSTSVSYVEVNSPIAMK